MPRKLVLGLGNPGDRYRGTRHNLGFWVVEELARRRKIALDRVECRSRLAEDEALVLAAPETYMNRSGYAARCFVETRGLEPSDLLVVFDEVYLPLGRLRLRPSGSPGGHRGMESVLENLRTDQVPRLRLGIGREEPGSAPTGEDLSDFVLAPFTADEKAIADDLVARAADCCEAWVEAGIAAAMNRYNR